VGLHTLPGSQYTGRVEVVDIGLPAGSESALKVELMTDEWIAGLLPEQPAESNKSTFGRVLVIAAGSYQRRAARRLRRARGRRAWCKRTSPSPIVAAGLDERYPLPDKEGGLSEKGVPEVQRVLEGFDVVLIGPGLGGRARTLEFVRALLFSLKEGTPTATVVDADALNILGGVRLARVAAPFSSRHPESCDASPARASPKSRPIA
jgi:NAD(P)H-hydrate epimerase